MSKKLKPEAVKVMIAKATAVKLVPIIERLDNAEAMLRDMQRMLKAIESRLNIAPDDPAYERLTAGLESDPLHEAALQRFPSLRAANPLVLPANRKAIETVFRKRGWKEGDTVESVLKEAQGG